MIEMRTIALITCAAACLQIAPLVFTPDVQAEDEDGNTSRRIIDADPYDRITLIDAEGGGAFRVRPLPLPDRRVPAEPKPNDLLAVELIGDTPAKAEIAWRKIEKLELYEQLVLAEAEQLVAGRKFDEAFDYYTFLHEQYPHTQRLADSSQNYLFLNAAALFKEKREESSVAALALLEELHRQNAGRAGLAAALSKVTDEMLSAHEAAERYDEARRLLQRTVDRGGADDFAQRWREKFQKDAAEDLQTAKGHVGKQEYRQAHRAVQRAVAIWPSAAGAGDLLADLYRRYPIVRVATGPFDDSPIVPRRLHPVHRRRAKLLSRPLVTLAGYAANGPRHHCDWGNIGVSGDRREIEISLANDSDSSPALTGYDIARLLAAASKRTDGARAGNSSSPVYSVEVDRVYTARVRLRLSGQQVRL